MTIPPWLQPADPVSAYTRGVALGATMGEQVRRNARDAQLLQARAVENERDRMLRQAEMEMNFAYRQAQLGLEQRQLEEKAARDNQMMQMNEQFKQAQIARMQAMTERESIPAWTPETPESLGGADFLTQRNVRTGAVRRTPVGLSSAQKAIQDRALETKQLSVMNTDIRELEKEAATLEQFVPPPGAPIKSEALKGKVDRYNQIKTELDQKRKARTDFMKKAAVPMPETGTDLDEDNTGEPPSAATPSSTPAPSPTPQPQPAPKPKGRKLTKEKAQEYYAKTDPKLPRVQRIKLAQEMAAADGYTEE